MDKARFKNIERVLFNYDANKAALTEFRKDIIHGVKLPEVQVQSGRTCSSTEAKGMRLLHRDYLKIEREVLAVELALKQLPKEYRDLFVLKYQRCWVWELIFPRVNCSRPTCFRMRDKIVYSVWAKLKILNNHQRLGA